MIIKFFLLVWLDSTFEYGLINIRRNKFSSFPHFQGKEVIYMSEFFEHLLFNIFMERTEIVPQQNEENIDDKDFDRLYKKIIDMAVIKLFEKTVENDILCVVFRQLSRTERLIILFNVLMDYEAEYTAKAIGTDKNTVYNLKHRALKKFQAAIEDLEN